MNMYVWQVRIFGAAMWIGALVVVCAVLVSFLPPGQVVSVATGSKSLLPMMACSGYLSMMAGALGSRAVEERMLSVWFGRSFFAASVLVFVMFVTASAWSLSSFYSPSTTSPSLTGLGFGLLLAVSSVVLFGLSVLAHLKRGW